MNVGTDVVDLHKKRIIREIKKNTAEIFQFRVNIGALFPKIRKLIKSVNEKLSIVNFSPDVHNL